MIEEKVRIGIKYAKIGLLIAFTGAFAILVLEHFNFINEIKPIVSEEELKSLDTILLWLILAVVFAPITEEAVFRLLPIGAVFLICGKKNKLILWPVIIMSSIIFGWTHGSWHNIFMQGLVGIIFSIAFLKGGYVSSVVAHAVFNFVIMILSIIGILFYQSPP